MKKLSINDLQKTIKELNNEEAKTIIGGYSKDIRDRNSGMPTLMAANS